MSDDFQRLLQSTEEHLLCLKASGVRYLNVSAETIEALSGPPPPSASPMDEAVGQIKSPSSGAEAVCVPEVQMDGSVEQARKKEAMEKLRQKVLYCLKCEHLAKSRKNVVFGVGDIFSPLMFIGEAPGADEDAKGEPFVGAAGQLLTRIINAMGFSRQGVYIANILKCRPDTPRRSSGNRKPTPEEMRTCLPYLLEQIQIIQPKVIVALGVTAMEGLFGKCDGISKLRGRFQSLGDIPLMPTYHPAYLLRTQSQSDKRKVWEDMMQVMEKLGRPISEKQRNYFLTSSTS